jgi:hypothetical protein
VTGTDGKTYPARQPEPAPAAETAEERDQRERVEGFQRSANRLRQALAGWSELVGLRDNNWRADIIAHLTDIERERLDKAERRLHTASEDVVAKGLEAFADALAAFDAIRDNRQFEEAGFSTFEDYCATRWGREVSEVLEIAREATR